MLFRYQTALAVLLGFCVVLPNCTLDDNTAICGHGIPQYREECDDGNNTDGDGCSALCKREDKPATAECGDGTVDAGEQCDDNNTTDNDGCSSTCKTETSGSGGMGSGGMGSGGMGSGGMGSGGMGSGGDGEGGIGGDGGTLPSKVIYLTATPVNSNFGGVVGADSACNTTRPNAGTYKALIVDGTTRVACTTANCGGGAEGTDWVLAADTSYGRPDGTLIGTTNGAGIFVFPLDAGIVAGELSYWTGLMGDWTTSDDTCSGWTSTSGSVFADEGLGGFTDSSAIRGVSDNCGLPKAFFACVEQ